MSKKIIVYGAGKIAELMLHFLSKENQISIEAFTLDNDYINSKEYLGLPIVEIDKVSEKYPPANYDLMVMIGHGSMRNRKAMFEKAKSLGYQLPNYISPDAIVADDIELGENNIIFGGCYLGPFGKMEDNNIIRPNTYIGHDFQIGSHNFIAPGVSIGGMSTIGNLCFMGIGSSSVNGLKIADETLLGGGGVLLKDTESYTFYAGNPAKKIKKHKENGIKV